MPPNEFKNLDLQTVLTVLIGPRRTLLNRNKYLHLGNNSNQFFAGAKNIVYVV